jgi:hypothetical protein
MRDTPHFERRLIAADFGKCRRFHAEIRTLEAESKQLVAPPSAQDIMV